MALNLDPLFEDMVRQFQTITTDERMRYDFVAAVNKVFDELSFAADSDSAITHVNQPSETVSGLNEDDTYIVSAGLVFHLIMAGREHVLRDKAYEAAKAEWEDRKGDFMVKQSRLDQADVDDDGEGADIIGLGDVTDTDDD